MRIQNLLFAGICFTFIADFDIKIIIYNLRGILALKKA
jgi:hypothetical protein